MRTSAAVERSASNVLIFYTPVKRYVNGTNSTNCTVQRMIQQLQSEIQIISEKTI